jgi:hypothetical protein
MSINFKVTPKFNPTKPEDPPRYYARVVTAGKRLTTDQFCEQIADISTVSTIDVKAVLNAFRHVIPIRMREGWRLNIVDLFDIYPASPAADPTPQKTLMWANMWIALK